MKWILMFLPTLVFAQESLVGKVAEIRARHHNLSAKQINDVVRILTAADVERALAAPPIVDSGFDIGVRQPGPADANATFAAGLVDDSELRLIERVRADHPELSPGQIADIHRLLN